MRVSRHGDPPTRTSAAVLTTPTANSEGNESLKTELERLVDAFEKQVTVTSMRKQERTPTLTVR